MENYLSGFGAGVDKVWKEKEMCDDKHLMEEVKQLIIATSPLMDQAFKERIKGLMAEHKILENEKKALENEKRTLLIQIKEKDLRIAELEKEAERLKAGTE